MSYIQVLVATKDNPELSVMHEVQNSWGGAMAIWSHFAFNRPSPFNDEAERVWQRCNDGYYSVPDTLLIASTYDNILIDRELIGAVGQVWVDFGTPQSISVGEYLLSISEDHNVLAVGFIHTTVAGDLWEVETDEIDEWGDKIWRMYNVETDDEGAYYISEYMQRTKNVDTLDVIGAVTE